MTSTPAPSPGETARDSLAQGRASYERQAWREACAQLSAADRERPLDPEDLVRLATAAHLVGREAELGAIWARAHQGFLERGDVPRAARCAFWLALPLILRGDRAQSSGWLARAARQLDEGRCDCVERGYLVFADALRSMIAGDPATAHTRFAEAVRVGERFREPDLVAFARHGQGRALIAMGQTSRGAALLDEAMAAIAAGEVSPMLVGDVYCSVIEACHEMFDLRRAHEWTAALSEWCARHPDMAPYRGPCLLHRAEMLQLHGAWQSAEEEAERAREHFAQPPPSRAIGKAFYQIGELHRLRGELTAAEEAYREASRSGSNAQPGQALLLLACGQVGAARSAIAHALEDPAMRRRRVRLLPAYVEISLAAGDVAAARTAADELSRAASGDTTSFLRALAAHATGAVLLAEGDARNALAALRQAMMLWQEVETPYDAARTRMLVGLACRALGDEDAAVTELEGARASFEALGARPDAERASAHAGGSGEPATTLTPRELQVLRLIATGRTNRAIALELGISEKTAARHVSNIFTKLDLSSRAAATAYAYEHELLARHT